MRPNYAGHLAVSEYRNYGAPIGGYLADGRSKVLHIELRWGNLFGKQPLESTRSKREDSMKLGLDINCVNGRCMELNQNHVQWYPLLFSNGLPFYHIPRQNNPISSLNFDSLKIRLNIIPYILS